MTKLHPHLFAGTLAVAALPGVAVAQSAAELGAARAYDIALASTTTDLARTRTYEDGIKRLRKTDEEFTNEQASIRFSPDGKRAVYVHMRTSPINEGTPMQSSPTHRMQCDLTALETYQEADGTVAVRRPADAPYDIWATDNIGNEYRNCNLPQLYVINGGKNIALEFNYQPGGTNDTRRYMKVFDWQLKPIPVESANGTAQKQVVVMAKNNDDCAMHQSGGGPSGMPYHDQAGVTRLIHWRGCNGNGRDDGWAAATEISCQNDATGAATKCTIKRLFDLSMEPREERSRGRCTIGTDRSFAVCTWTAGNSQPQREGTWIGAVDLSPNGPNGENAQGRLLWKERLAHRKSFQVNGQGREYYAMRAQHARIVSKNADGLLLPSDELMVEYTWNRGGNNNDKKGGRSDLIDFGVIKATRTGLSFSMPLTTINMGTSPMLLGFDGTHIAMTEAIFGKGDQLLPGFTQLHGSHTGGLSAEADVRTIAYDPATKSLVNLGQHTLGASYDRHLYSNYLGNNPGNQGRNFAGADVFKNPFAGMNGNKVTYYTAFALTGKAQQHVDSAIKPSAFLSLLPTAFVPNAPDPGAGYNDNLPGDNIPDDPAPEEPDPVAVAGETSVGGCSTGSPGTGALALLALGLAFTIRRRK